MLVSKPATERIHTQMLTQQAEIKVLAKTRLEQKAVDPKSMKDTAGLRGACKEMEDGVGPEVISLVHST